MRMLGRECKVGPANWEFENSLSEWDSCIDYGFNIKAVQYIILYIILLLGAKHCALVRR